MFTAPQTPRLPTVFETRLHLASSLLFILLVGAWPAATQAAHHDDAYGVLVMAHGGNDEWDQAVLEAVEPLRAEYPVEVAFGMADASTIDEGVSLLEAAGVERIGVVRLFISGESWFERTEQILGLTEGAPSAAEVEAGEGHRDGHGPHVAPPDESEHDNDAVQAAHDSDTDGAHGDTDHQGSDESEAGQDGEGHHMAAFYRIETDATFALSTEGLAEAPEMDEILLVRARELSRDPHSEDVLFLAHGPGDDTENEQWIATIDDRAELLRREIPFRRVEVMTLREDWPEKREAAEERVREFVRRAREEGGQAIVIPYRVFGFGPYAEILEDLEYISDGQGLIPHEAVTRWIDRQASSLREGTFRATMD
jgi:sirohydrochlorin cobaltochelatase